ncbi:MAG TPA: helix-turn-helix domain-containing protein [Gemmatimonadaceae bacterium]
MRVRTATELGHLARDRRLHLGLTQAALAARVGVSRKWIIDLEAGKRTMDLSLALRSLNVLGLELRVTPGDRSRPASGASVIDAVINSSRRR